MNAWLLGSTIDGEESLMGRAFVTCLQSRLCFLWFLIPLARFVWCSFFPCQLYLFADRAKENEVLPALEGADGVLPAPGDEPATPAPPAIAAGVVPVAPEPGAGVGTAASVAAAAGAGVGALTRLPPEGRNTKLLSMVSGSRTELLHG